MCGNPMKFLAPKTIWYLSPTKEGKHPSNYHYPYLAPLYFTLLNWSTQAKHHPFRFYGFMTTNRLMRWWASTQGKEMDWWEILSWELRTDMDNEILRLIKEAHEKTKP